MPRTCVVCKNTIPDLVPTCPRCGARVPTADERLFLDEAPQVSDALESPPEELEQRKTAILEDVPGAEGHPGWNAPPPMGSPNQENPEVPVPSLDDELITFTDSDEATIGPPSSDPGEDPDANPTLTLPPPIPPEQHEEGSTLQDSGPVDFDHYIPEKPAQGPIDPDLLERDVDEEADIEEGGSAVEEADVPPVPPRRRTRWPVLAVVACLLLIIGGVAVTLMLLGPPRDRSDGKQLPGGAQELRERGDYQALLALLANDSEHVALRGEARLRLYLQQHHVPGQHLDLNTSPELQRARKELQTGANQSPPNADALFWLGNLYVHTGQPGEAREQFTRGVQTFPNQKRFQAALDRLDTAPE